MAVSSLGLVALLLGSFSPLECKFLGHFPVLCVLLMGGRFGLLESLPECGKFVVCIDGLEKVMWQKSYKDPWGLKWSLMARHELEEFWCSSKVLWGPKWPWNSLNTRNYMYDWQTYFLPSPQLCQVQLMLFSKESEEQISLNWRWCLCFDLLSLDKASFSATII